MGNIIKQFRETRGLTQEQLGELVGVKKAAVCKWEDDIAPSPISAIRLEEISDGVLARWMTRPDLWEPPEQSPFRLNDQDQSAPSAASPRAAETQASEEVKGAA